MGPEPKKKNGARRRRSHNRCGVRLFQRLGRAAKAVVQAKAHGLEAGVETVGGNGIRGVTEPCAAEIDILIFAFERPSRIDFIFDAAAGHPARLCAAAGE